MAITNETKYVTVRRLNRFKEKLDTEISDSLSDYAQKSELATVATSGSYNDLVDKPSNVSSFTNDAGYLTQHQSLDNYYTKTEVNGIVENAAVLDENGNPVLPAMQETLESQQQALQAAALEIEEHNARITTLEEGSSGGTDVVEGYLRISGSSDPSLSYRHYGLQEGVASESVFAVFYPCLVGNNLTGNVGVIRNVLRKLGAVTDNGVAKWEDLEGNLHLIDGSEGDVMVVNIVSYWQIAGHYTVDGVTMDVFLRSRSPFVWHGVEAEEIEPYGESPDYTVAHSDSGTMVMHSVYNPSWDGSYTAPYGVEGRYVVTEQSGEITETYDANATMLGGAGGLHSTNITLYDGEQYAMNMQGGSAPVPYYNKTARGAELLWIGLAAEGGTFDSHKKELFGSGFTHNDVAVAADYEASGTNAANGVRVKDKNDNWQYYGLGSNVRFLTGLAEGAKYAASLMNDWRNPFHVMEAYRAVCHAVRNNVPELTWFAFEGCKYKYRSAQGYDGPVKGEATCVVWKMLSTKASASAVDPTDGVTSIAGNRVDVIVTQALWHGVTMQASPSWWTSGLIFTEDEDGKYEAYMERDQASLIKSETGDKLTSEQFQFETAYDHIMTLNYGLGYRKDYNDDALMLPKTAADATGAGLHTYVGAYNYFSGSKAPEGKKSVRGFRRGYAAVNSYVSPLFVYANDAPSDAHSSIAFGTCCRIQTE